MSTLKSSIWMLPVFVLGVGVGSVVFSHTRSVMRENLPGVDLTQPIMIYPCDTPGDEITYTPYRSCVNGVRQAISEPPHGEYPSYRIELNNGQVVLYAVKKPTM